MRPRTLPKMALVAAVAALTTAVNAQPAAEPPATPAAVPAPTPTNRAVTQRPASSPPQEPASRSHANWMRAFVNLDVIAGGEGRARTYLAGGEAAAAEVDYKLEPSWGVDGGVAFRVARFLSIGATLRWFTTQFDDAPVDAEHHTHVDAGPIAIFRVELGQIEIHFPTQVALSLYFPPGAEPNGAGLIFGFTPGVLGWISDHVALQANLGYEVHIVAGRFERSGPAFVGSSAIRHSRSFHNARLSGGVSVGF